MEAKIILSKKGARLHWMKAQGLLTEAPFGSGAQATPLAVEHLGYVQIDTINVIERCHHHILYSRIPNYQRSHLQRAQTQDKTVFEYWTHALSYVSTKDFRYFAAEMKKHHRLPYPQFRTVAKNEFQKILRLIKKEGALSIREIDDDVLVEKNHPWASRKPSKKALQLGFYSGHLAISERIGMLKKYELLEKHFGWKTKPKPATEKEILNYILDRSLRAQAIVSLESICHLEAKRKPLIKKLIESRVKAGTLVAVGIEGNEKTHWMEPDLPVPAPEKEFVHLLSPFDPLVILRKRLKAFFDYEHRFEAYLPKEKRIFGYFALPVLIGDQVVAAIDLKTDRQNQKLLIQEWTWIGKTKSPARKAKIEDALDRFEKFQLART